MSTNHVQSLRALLIADSGVTAIVGSGTATRIWAEWPRTYTVPCIVLEPDTEAHQNDLTGHSDRIFADVTLTCRANSFVDSRALADAVMAVLAGYTGSIEVVVDDVQHSNQFKGDGSADQWYDHTLSLNVTWTQRD